MEGNELKIHGFFSVLKIFIFWLWHSILLCKNVNNYCAWLYHFVSILSLLKNKKTLVTLFYECFWIFYTFNPNYFTYFYNIWKNYHVNLSKAYNISTKFVIMMLEGALILKT
jgi:hypothetical protein